MAPKVQHMPLTSLVALLTVAFAAALQARATDPMLPVIAADLSVSLRDAFLLSSAFALPMAVMQLVLGPTADALGKVRVIRTCLAILVVGTVLSALATSYGLLMAARVLTGAVAGGIIPMTMALMADKVPAADRQAAFGRVMAAATSAQVIGTAMAGAIVGTLGWRFTYGVMAAVAALAVIVALRFIERDVTQPRRFSARRAAFDYGRLYGSPGSKLIAGISFANGVLIVALFPLLAPLLQQRGGNGPFQAGVAIAGFACGGVLLGIAMRWIAGRVPLPALMRMGFVLAGVSHLAVALPVPWLATVPLYLVVGFGFFSLQNSLLALITDLVPEARGSAVSILLCGLFSGQTLGPVLWGVFAEYTSFSSCFVVAGLLLLSQAAIIGQALARSDLPRQARS